MVQRIATWVTITSDTPKDDSASAVKGIPSCTEVRSFFRTDVRSFFRTEESFYFVRVGRRGFFRIRARRLLGTRLFRCGRRRRLELEMGRHSLLGPRREEGAAAHKGHNVGRDGGRGIAEGSEFGDVDWGICGGVKSIVGRIGCGFTITVSHTRRGQLQSRASIQQPGRLFGGAVGLPVVPELQLGRWQCRG
jgi:hypothetical protein